LTGPLSDLTATGPPKPDADWLSNAMWNEVLTISELWADSHPGLAKHFQDDLESWRRIYDCVEAHLEPLPGAWNDLDMLSKILVLRALRIDKVTDAVLLFVAEKIGRKFVEPPTFDIAKSFSDSSSTTPLIFILSPGVDPITEVMEYAEKSRHGKTVREHLARPRAGTEGNEDDR